MYANTMDACRGINSQYDVCGQWDKIMEIQLNTKFIITHENDTENSQTAQTNYRELALDIKNTA